MKRLPPLFLTGATGFVGRHLLAELGGLPDCEVTALVRSRAAPPEDRLSGIVPGGNPRVTPVEGDLRSPESYTAAVPAGALIIHLASRTGPGRSEEYFATNLQGTRSLLRASADARVRRFVHVSTVAVTFRDLRHYPYARSKRAAEEAVRESGVPYTIIRPTLVAGRGGGAWEGLLRLARLPLVPVPGDGETRMQPLAVGDLARGLIRAAELGAAEGETLVFGGPEALPVRDLLDRMHRQLTGAPARFLHLPGRATELAAEVVERVVPGRPPLTRGQLRSFLEDGTVETSPLLVQGCDELMGVDEMIRSFA